MAGSDPVVKCEARAWWRTGFLVLLAALALAGVWLVHVIGARPPAWYPPCLVHRVTGLHCPGCGAARAVHALGHGDFIGAVDQNALLIASVPLLLTWIVREARRFRRGERFSPSLPGGWALGILLAVIVFTVARNVPWWPFVLLAPD